MPTIRTILTFSEVKDIIAEKYHICNNEIEVFENNELLINYDFCGPKEINDDTYLFQFDNEN